MVQRRRNEDEGAMIAFQFYMGTLVRTPETHVESCSTQKADPVAERQKAIGDRLMEEHAGVLEELSKT